MGAEGANIGVEVSFEPPSSASSVGGALACSISLLLSNSCLSSVTVGSVLGDMGGGDVEDGRMVSADLADVTEAGGPGVEGVAIPLDGDPDRYGPP